MPTPTKRGRPKGSTDKAPRQPKSSNKAPSQKSGIAYVYDNGLVNWSDPSLDIDKIKTMMRNPYLKRPVTQLMNLLFPHGDAIITVQDENEHVDEEAAKKLRQLFRTRECNIKKLAKTCWLSWFYWGPFVYNVVYDEYPDSDGWKIIKEIRHLPSETFSQYPVGVVGKDGKSVRIVSESELLPGISRYSDGNIYYSQTDSMGKPVLLHDVVHEVPPNDLSGDPAGMPICYVVLSLIEMLNFCWAAQRSRVSRVGSPSIFLIVTDPQERTDATTGKKTNDLEYAQDVLQNWGRNNMFPLLGNMEPKPVPSNESDSAMETIAALAKLINDQWSPIGLISTEGSSKIGGGDNAGLDLLRSFRSGFLDPVAEIFVRIGEDWLLYNGFTNYTVFIKFPEFNPQNDDVDLRRAQEGRAAKTISRNEHRAFLGLEYATVDDLDDFDEEWGIEEPIIPNVEKKGVVEDFDEAEATVNPHPNTNDKVTKEDKTKTEVKESVTA